MLERRDAQVPPPGSASQLREKQWRNGAQHPDADPSRLNLAKTA
jgi:hypothetical protein